MSMRMSAVFVLSAVLFAGACDAGEAGDAPPSAPANLTVEPLSGGAHLQWGDSDTETEYMVMRMEDGVDTEMQVISTLPFDTVQYHDAPLTSGSTYMYMVMAMNNAGETESDEVEFTAP